MNTIFTISPYKYNGQWVFDDESRGLDKEALIAGADTMCDILSKGKDNFTLVFSGAEFPGAEYSATKTFPEFQGMWYHCTANKLQFWLCRELYRFFKEAPDTLYFKTS